MHVIKPQPAITFHSFSFAISQRDRAAARAASSSTGGEEVGYEGGGGGRVLCHKHPPRFPPPMPRTIRLWQVPVGQTVNFNKLWVTVSDKSPCFSPPELGGILCRTAMLPDMHGHTMTHVCGGKQASFYASLARGVDFHMRDLDGTRSSASQDVLHISKPLNRTENTFFQSCWISEGRLSSSRTHTFAK